MSSAGFHQLVKVFSFLFFFFLSSCLVLICLLSVDYSLVL